MSILLWLLYGVSVLMAWYENRWIVCAWPLDRPTWFSPGMQGKVWLLRLAVSYGIFAGLWFYNGLATAAIAFASYYVFQKISFHIYFTREVQMTAQRYANLSRKEANSKNEQADESAIMQQALEIARITVVRNMKGGEF